MTTFIFAGTKSEQVGAGEVTVHANLYSLAEQAKKFRRGDPVYYDELVYAMRTVAWGRLTMSTALLAFLCKIGLLALRWYAG